MKGCILAYLVTVLYESLPGWMALHIDILVKNLPRVCRNNIDLPKDRAQMGTWVLDGGVWRLKTSFYEAPLQPYAPASALLAF